MSEQLKEFTVVRDEWGRGQGNGRLLDRDTGKKCCLGFLSLACGYAEDEIAALAYPRDIDGEYLPGVDPGLSGEEDRIGKINDDRLIDGAERERLLTEEFAKFGITVRFV